MPPSKSSPTFNPWPYSLIAFFALFILAVVSYARFAIQHDVELVAVDYYERELQFADQMQRIARTRALGDEVALTHDSNSQSLILRLPNEHVAAGVHGQITLYYPAKSARDRIIPLKPNEDGTQQIPYAWLSGGRWKVQVAWTAQAAEYFLEESVDLRLPTQ